MKTEIKDLPVIYNRNTNSSIQQWQIVVNNNTFYTIEGLVNGKLTTSKATIVTGKSYGRSNETSDEEQAYLEAKRKWDKKIEQGYSEDIKNIDNSNKYFEPMLAEKYIDRKDKVVFPMLGQWKIDGHRLIATKNGCFTRNGKQYKSCPHISDILKPLFVRHPNWIIDGEIYSHNENFEKISSLVRKTKPTAEDIIKSQELVQLWIFDGIVDDKNLGFEKRFNIIKEEILSLNNKSLILVETFKINNTEDIEFYHTEAVKQGFEGLMLRVIDSCYENKRSVNLLKYKKFFDDEFEIIDVIEGIGNRSKMAGSLMLKTKDNKIFNSGIRGSEDYYKELLNNKLKLIGKSVTIRYQEKTADGIPRFPIAVQIDREDLR